MSNINEVERILVIGSIPGLGWVLALSILVLPYKLIVILCGLHQEILDELPPV
ncbi:hypothetical protein BKA82DRAFT_1006310 [Pisolithus tinctorius]|uniref:Uncharacterized protein n=1 Tax=Pisolithus tinctorius Marx 270 TaxID=870435 RepID=A0A0C3NN22_PISTI|nr:hypothetical protein BKA82DRAFT_1006310 [Pisolithus tinctorius]KIN97030.1 hypothetical protein M404DRAFT_1006310 [Pisolithus tinctorius Marx 270]